MQHDPRLAAVARRLCEPAHLDEDVLDGDSLDADGPDRDSLHKDRSNQVGPHHVGPDRGGPDQVGRRRDRPDQDRPDQDGPDQDGPDEACQDEGRVEEPGLDAARNRSDPAAPSRTPPEPPQQLWLDVARPIVTRPRARPAGQAAGAKAPPPIDRRADQIEMPMPAGAGRRAAPGKPAGGPPASAAPDRAGLAATIDPAPPVPPPAPARSHAAPLPHEPEPPLPFAVWLLGQAKQPGTLGELARAARLDRLFPKTGSAEDVRARFNQAGADGEAHDALDAAERAFDGLA